MFGGWRVICKVRQQAARSALAMGEVVQTVRCGFFARPSRFVSLTGVFRTFTSTGNAHRSMQVAMAPLSGLADLKSGAKRLASHWTREGHVYSTLCSRFWLACSAALFR